MKNESTKYLIIGNGIAGFRSKRNKENDIEGSITMVSSEHI